MIAWVCKYAGPDAVSSGSRSFGRLFLGNPPAQPGDSSVPAYKGGT